MKLMWRIMKPFPKVRVLWKYFQKLFFIFYVANTNMEQLQKEHQQKCLHFFFTWTNLQENSSIILYPILNEVELGVVELPFISPSVHQAQLGENLFFEIFAILILYNNYDQPSGQERLWRNNWHTNTLTHVQIPLKYI